MSSADGENDVSRGSDDVHVEQVNGALEDGAPLPGRPDSELKHILAEEKENLLADQNAGSNGTTFHGAYAKAKQQQDVAPESPPASLPDRTASYEHASPDGSVSTPDDTPSVQGSGLTSPASSTPVSFASFARPQRPASLQPFERRFSSRISPSPLGSPRADSPGFLSPRSRQSSVSSPAFLNQDDTDTPQPPWEVVRWTKLKKITGQAFSEIGKRNFGKPTCLAVAASIAVGTSKGLILVFDYHQTLKSIVGPGTKAVESGSITSLAFSADHTTIAGGHASGNIFTWELARPAKPFLHITPLDKRQLENRQADGHVPDTAVLHLGFLGTRHTALVSADEGGMAFSHLATRGLGAVGRTVKTARILGRYPPLAHEMDQPRKPSSVLAFSPLPLGNVEQPTDGLGLTALLTPYLLVVVSTTPIAETQHKATRPKEIAPHSALSGCLAWFPAVKLKGTGGEQPQAVSKTKLVYCWSNILTVLDVDAHDTPEKDKPPNLHFRTRSRWRTEEAIVAVQWLSRSVLGVLTISQRLIILEDNSLRMTDSFDLLQKHIYHRDLFSRQLHPVVEQHDEMDESMHGVVADAFYMAFRAYKGRLFLLGFNDVSIGTLSNWADRLLALMEEGDYIASIELATSYYNGDADKLTVGLPSDDVARHALVQEKLVEMISASLKFTFSRNKDQQDKEASHPRLLALASVSFSACLSMQELEFLFEDVYEAFQNASSESAFFDVLEPYIVDEEIPSLPPHVLKDLITYYASQGRAERLEEMICRLETSTIDINQVTILCKQYSLYDALVYVWTQAVRDYITPLIDLFSIVKKLLANADADGTAGEQDMDSAMKLFPYLSFTLTGRIYPNGLPMVEQDADEAKAALYSYIFSGKLVEWPRGSGEIFCPPTDDQSTDSFPYLRMILKFDAASFMSMLNEAFEDSYLNGDHASTPNGMTNGTSRERSPAWRPTRQYILNILLGVMSDGQFEPEDTIYFNMFVARNLPKFPQYIILPGSALHKLVEGLCEYPSDEVADDCQLSVEYLLSVYHPPDIESLVPLFERAGFHRVLKFVFSGAKQYPRLLEAYFNDTEDKAAIFDCIRDILRPNKGLNKKQVAEVHAVISAHAFELASIDAAQTARTLRVNAPSLLRDASDALDADSYVQFLFLRALLEANGQVKAAQPDLPLEVMTNFTERYVQLMCKFDPGHVADYVGVLRSGNLRLDHVLPAMEESGVIDAAVVLMAQGGLVRHAMDRLVKHVGTLETALVSLLDAAAESPDTANTEETAADLLEAVQKYTKIGIWLCQGQTKAKQTTGKPQAERRESGDGESEQHLESDELLWLDLIDVTVTMTRAVSLAASQLAAKSHDGAPPIDTTKITTSLRADVQQTFSALLASMAAGPATKAAAQQQQQQQQGVATAGSSNDASARPAPPSRSATAAHQPSASFLRILRAFLARAARSSPSLSDLRAVLADIFAAYAFEEALLGLATRFLEADVFARVDEVQQLRERGWRPKGQACAGCSGRVWGPGAGGGVWEAWERRQERERRAVGRKRSLRGDGDEASKLRKGKGRDTAKEVDSPDSPDGAHAQAQLLQLDQLVVFACRHLWHRGCVERAQPEPGRGGEEAVAAGAPEREFTCPLCG
ncbi:uncharacterized protein K452DRAFT_218600 [Aplosporella prunicola CBS 121167]|uniref:Uncharacterized protein n=1 Tax=Aplosporella prunicola CBS 121167 TaxID=1176127 RepID=A0A6A6BSK6_9PEZI|nr:uncharacterized protein K452DRAFT_218600 [Aplosporella prunicola CBS 121167]KAF2146980.1 hypothetical protein K452DRAFT_218600 [Aplosporella prunicola CBS 121167]